MKTSKEYRKESKAALKGNWGMGILLSLVYALLLGATSATGIGSILLSGALAVGYSYALVQLYRKGRYDVGDLFEGFRKNFGETIALSVLKAVYLILWSLLLFIPAIIKHYSYSMAEFIFADHPELTGSEAITASKKLMKGKKWRLFCLDFSFIGWILLSAFTFGILLIWVEPWIYAAKAAFYESIKDETELPD